MWEEILRLALGNGLWAVLFCVLLCYGLRDSRARESKYRQTIDLLCDRLKDLQGVREAMEELSCAVKSRRAPKTIVREERLRV